MRDRAGGGGCRESNRQSETDRKRWREGAKERCDKKP